MDHLRWNPKIMIDEMWEYVFVDYLFVDWDISKKT